MLKQDQKRMKKEVDKLPKATKKEEMKIRKEKLDLYQQNQVCDLLLLPFYFIIFSRTTQSGPRGVTAMEC